MYNPQKAKLREQIEDVQSRIDELRSIEKRTSEQHSQLNALSVKLATQRYQLRNMREGQPTLGLPDHHGGSVSIHTQIQPTNTPNS